jgi:hypothetical protein
MYIVTSPDLYDSVNEEDNNSEKSVYSSYRYFERACTRCTPFGLFAGCSVGMTGDNTEIFLSDTKDYQCKTRLDMNYICALTQQIEKEMNLSLSTVQNHMNQDLKNIYEYLDKKIYF